jgi:gliding motility-associated-like protein
MLHKFCLLVFFTVWVGSFLHATHIVGGELTYRCLGNDTYEISLSVYRDCYNGVPPFDNPAAIGIFNDQYQLLDSLLLPVSSIDDTLDIFLNNPCLIAPPDVCVHRTTYSTTLSLPPILGGYNLVYQRCCRNELIKNIPLPEDVGITIIAEINEQALNECNQGAFFNNWPPLAICVHEPIDFDHSATDGDGDSLAYRLCTPLSGATRQDPLPQPPNPGPYDEVVWLDPPYNLSNLLGGQALSIDPLTGFITGIPNTIGNYVVGVCVDEFRGDSLISTTRRDFQYNVADCGQSQAAFFVPTLSCDNNTISITNQSQINALSTFDWYFDWEGGDGVGSILESPTYTYPDTGQYTIALVLNAAYACRDTFFQNVWVTETLANANFQIIYSDCDTSGVVVTFDNQSADPQFGIVNTHWFISGPDNWTFESDQASPSVRVDVPGQYFAVLKVTGGNGCEDLVQLSFEVPIPPLQQFDNQLLICPGDSVELFPGANSNFLYTWVPSDGMVSPTLPNPIVSPTATTEYMVTITDAQSICTRIGNVLVEIVDINNLALTATPSVIYVGESTQLNATFSGAEGFVWTPSNTLSANNIANPIASPIDTTTYTVVVQTSTKCMPTATITISVINPLCDEPYFFFPTGFSPNDDGENDILRLEGRFIQEVYWVIYNRWGQKVFEADTPDDAWDGTYKNQPQPSETYGYYLRVVCPNGQVTEKKGNVTLFR